jgi:hypothetical protein
MKRVRVTILANVNDEAMTEAGQCAGCWLNDHYVVNVRSTEDTFLDMHDARIESVEQIS